MASNPRCKKLQVDYLKELSTACINGDLEAVKKFIKAGANVNKVDRSSYPETNQKSHFRPNFKEIFSEKYN